MQSLQNDPTREAHPQRDYANDPSGFWEANKRANATNWRAVLPQGTLIQADRHEIQRILAAAIEWMAVDVRWGEITFRASLDDGQATAPLEGGGLGATGTVTLVFSRSQFANNWPAQHDTLQLLVQGDWKNFLVHSIADGFDGADDAIIAILEPEDAS